MPRHRPHPSVWQCGVAVETPHRAGVDHVGARVTTWEGVRIGTDGCLALTTKSNTEVVGVDSISGHVEYIRSKAQGRADYRRQVPVHAHAVTLAAMHPFRRTVAVTFPLVSTLALIEPIGMTVARILPGPRLRIVPVSEPEMDTTPAQLPSTVCVTVPTSEPVTPSEP